MELLWYSQEGDHLDINMKDFSIYTSPFSWRYGSDEMRILFSEESKYRLWRKIWVELARAQHKLGLVSKEELDDLEKHQDEVDIERIWAIEKDTRHDVVAAIKEFAEKAKIGGGKIHLGATSMDINDNAETIRISEAISIVKQRLVALLLAFSSKVEKYSDFVCMGYTHLQAAEPTTIGYRLAFYAQDLFIDLELLEFVKSNLKGKGMKGAVGTSASYIKLLGEEKYEEMEKLIMEKLGVESIEIANQTYPRKIDLLVADLLSSIAQSLNKFAFDLRIMQSAGFSEWQEPFSSTQVGSSAMPFKKNPVKSEQICSLSRLVINLARTAYDNASNMGLERTLDDSANRRVAIPEMFLSIDEMLTSATNIVDGLLINEKRVAKNLDTFWPFSASEGIIIEAVKKGADRQKMHEVLRNISMEAWNAMQEGEVNPMEDLVMSNPEIGKYLNSSEILELMDAKKHIGNAPKKALTIVKKIDNLKNL